jgi:hypothetical protein
MAEGFAAVARRLVGCAGILFLPCMAFADPIELMPSVFSASVQGGAGGTTLGHYAGNSSNGVLNMQQSTVDLSYDMTNPGVSQLATDTAMGDVSSVDALPPVSTATGVLTYYFEINGPDPSASVPTFAGASGLTSVSSGSDVRLTGAIARFTLGEPANSPLISEVACSGSVGVCLPTSPPLFNSTSMIPLSVDKVYDVELSASIQVTASQSGQFSALAEVDPLITIDPFWSQSHPGYSIEFSQVPEPSTLLALGAGLLMLVGARR